MNISNNLYINFTGIAPRYQNQNGFEVFPLEKKPNQKDINNAIKATKKDKLGQGYNGVAFELGQDLIVKKYKGNKAFNNDPMREINILDKMYDYKMKLRNSQKGVYAFETPTEEYYLVSTKVDGETPDPIKGNFNKKNLNSLVNQILSMDKGIIIKNSSKDSLSDRCRFMNYDFNGGNIKITPTKAGLFDFEYSGFENIDTMIQNANNYAVNCHESDTGFLPSSLRSFEMYCLCDYLKNCKNPNKIFTDYLEAKGKYHKKMSAFYKIFTKESKHTEYIEKLTKNEFAHSMLLFKNKDEKIPNDILKAEAIKIQMANFIHEATEFCDTGKINVSQMNQYAQNGIVYFWTMLQNAKKENDKNRIIYYNNGYTLFQKWKNTEDKIIDYQLKNDNKAIKEMIIAKMTKEHILTLDESLNFNLEELVKPFKENYILNVLS